MKWNIGVLLLAFVTVATWTGCGGKESTPPTPAPANNVASAPAAAVSAPPSPVNSEASPAPQNPSVAGQPSRPTFAGMGAPADPDEQASEPPAASSRPQQLGVGAMVGPGSPAAPLAANPSIPQIGALGIPGVSGTPPATGNFAGAPAESASNNNPFDDPSNLLPPTVELSLRDRAVNAFKSGNVTRAYALYQSYLLSASSDDLEDAMKNMRWDKKRVVPRLGYSFAVGLVVNNPNKVETLKPIGTGLEDLKGSPPGSSGGRGFGGIGAPGGGTSGSVPALSAKELSDAAGKFATTFITSFNQAHSDGKWSEAFREYEYGSSLTLPSFPSGFAGALGGGPPTGYGGAGGPPAGYPGGQGGPPAGYPGGQGGPPAGYPGGQGGPPAGYPGGGGAPPGYPGGAGSGPPPGYGGAPGGPPAGYGGGAGPGAPPGYGAPGATPPGATPPGGGQTSPEGQGNSGTKSPYDYVAPQDDDIGSFGTGPAQGARPGVGIPGIGRPGIDGPGLGTPGFGAPGLGAPSPAPPATLDPELAKDLQLPSGTIPLGAGLNYIGKGESVGELTKKANEQGYDALIVFEVDVSFIRVNSTIKNDCRIRVISLKGEMEAKEKTITSSLLNNRDVAADKDPDARVNTAVDIFMKKMSEAYPMDDLPNFKSESIQSKRLKDLVNDKARSKLDLLCEVELYASRGFVDNTLKEAAFERIAGSDGKSLATSEPEDRIPILEKMIRREFD